MDQPETPRNLVPLDQRELTLAITALDYYRTRCATSPVEECEDLREKLDSWREEA